MLTTPDAATHAATIAEIASRTARHYFRGQLGVEFKLDESPVTQADKAVEAKVRTYLEQHFPNHGIFGEEHGLTGRIVARSGSSTRSTAPDPSCQGIRCSGFCWGIWSTANQI